jgi:hypothetical protein
VKKETEKVWIEEVAALDSERNALHQGDVAEVSRWLAKTGTEADSVVIEWSDDTREYVSVDEFMKDWDNSHNIR